MTREQSSLIHWCSHFQSTHLWACHGTARPPKQWRVLLENFGGALGVVHGQSTECYRPPTDYKNWYEEDHYPGLDSAGSYYPYWDLTGTAMGKAPFRNKQAASGACKEVSSSDEDTPSANTHSPRAQAYTPKPCKGKKAVSPVPAPKTDKPAGVPPDIRVHALKQEQPPPHKPAKEDPIQPGRTPTQPMTGGLTGAPATFPRLFNTSLRRPVHVPVPITVPIPESITMPVALSPFVSVPVLFSVSVPVSVVILVPVFLSSVLLMLALVRLLGPPASPFGPIDWHTRSRAVGEGLYHALATLHLGDVLEEISHTYRWLELACLVRHLHRLTAPIWHVSNSCTRPIEDDNGEKSSLHLKGNQAVSGRRHDLGDELLDDTIPRITIKKFSNQKPWVDRTIREALNSRTAAYNAGIISGNMDEYKSAPYGVRRAVMEAKRRYGKKLETQFRL
ncbi:hypothetical protein P4O66_009373 [Electrophorus voltai]|uniref:Uncharacterized protein n=1 Tax=Electrophorus voltai TaxID=2609070 RepID=A0AAD9DUX6_9TELE|nr:hypothetical protein P4O66_009373 [Electrophorus voltai]